MTLVIKDFRFSPSTLALPLSQQLTIHIQSNQSNSSIYSQDDRFFILTITPIKDGQVIYDQEIETDPLYPNTHHHHSFQQLGDYLITCANYVQIKAKIKVIQNKNQIPITLDFGEAEKKKKKEPSPIKKNKDQLAIQCRKFKITQQEIKMLSAEMPTLIDQIKEQEIPILESSPSEPLVNAIHQFYFQNSQMIILRKSKKEKCSLMLSQSISATKRIMAMMKFLAAGTKNQRDSKVISFYEFSTVQATYSNADSMSTYNTSVYFWQTIRIETQSTFSEVCDQIQFHPHEIDRREGDGMQKTRKNSDPLIQNNKEESQQTMKKYRNSKCDNINMVFTDKKCKMYPMSPFQRS